MSRSVKRFISAAFGIPHGRRLSGAGGGVHDYTAKEIAELMGLSLGSTYSLVRDGTIPAKKMGARWVIPKKRFHAWLDESTASNSESIKATPTRSIPEWGLVLMGHIVKTPAGSYRANWRDTSGRQRAKTFRTRKEASAFLAEVEAALNRGAHVDPHADRMRFGNHATRWLAARNDERTTVARDMSIMRTHVLPRWGQRAAGEDRSSRGADLGDAAGERLSAATVAECYRHTAGVLRSARRDHLIGADRAMG